MSLAASLDMVLTLQLTLRREPLLRCWKACGNGLLTHVRHTSSLVLGACQSETERN